MEVDAFLQKHGVELDYGQEDLELDCKRQGILC